MGVWVWVCSRELEGRVPVSSREVCVCGREGDYMCVSSKEGCVRVRGGEVQMQMLYECV